MDHDVLLQLAVCVTVVPVCAKFCSLFSKVAYLAHKDGEHIFKGGILDRIWVDRTENEKTTIILR